MISVAVRLGCGAMLALTAMFLLVMTGAIPEHGPVYVTLEAALSGFLIPAVLLAVASVIIDR